MNVQASEALVTEQRYQPQPVQRSVVGAEWRGKARTFIRRIQQQNDLVTEASRAAFWPLYERASRNPTPRRDDLIEAIRQWQDTMPIGGRLHVECKLERKSLHLTELRLTGCEYSKDPWREEHTDALLLTEFHMIASRDETKLYTKLVGMLSLHACARWFERSGDNSEPQLLCDLLKVARSRDELYKMCKANHGDWSLQAPSGGTFRGELCYRNLNGKREQFFGIGTYIPEATVWWSA